MQLRNTHLIGNTEDCKMGTLLLSSYSPVRADTIKSLQCEKHVVYSDEKKNAYKTSGERTQLETFYLEPKIVMVR
jgi:hypothetical protein